MRNFPTLQTERLSLREILPSDASAIFHIFGNPAVMTLSGSDPLQDVNAAHSLIEYFKEGRMLASPSTRWGIQLKDTATLIGTCGFFDWNRGWKKCSMGFELDVGWQKKGIMLEALSEVLAWGFREMQLNRVEVQIHSENYPSIKLVKSLGFAQEGLLRESAYWGGQTHHMLQFGLLSHELLPMNSKLT